MTYKFNVDDLVKVNDVIMLDTSKVFIVIKVDPYNDNSKFYEVSNGEESANVHEDRLSVL